LQPLSAKIGIERGVPAGLCVHAKRWARRQLRAVVILVLAIAEAQARAE
jgi:hypothetical protein